MDGNDMEKCRDILERQKVKNLLQGKFDNNDKKDLRRELANFFHLLSFECPVLSLNCEAVAKKNSNIPARFFLLFVRMFLHSWNVLRLRALRVLNVFEEWEKQSQGG